MRYSALAYAERMQALATIAAGIQAGRSREHIIRPEVVAQQACEQLAALELADDAAMTKAFGPKVPVHRL